MISFLDNALHSVINRNYKHYIVKISDQNSTNN